MDNLEGLDTQTLEFLSSLRVLCIEDHKTTRLMYELFLEDLVLEVILAKDGVEGLEIFHHEDVDLILTDYDMPNMNGMELIKKIREDNREIPIILVSAIEDADIIVDALNLNVNNFLKKPIVKESVINVLGQVSKLLMANIYIKEQQEKELSVLKEKEKYNLYQEDLAFAKELNILRNDFYYQMIDTDGISLIDFMYKPLDVISGDAYTARRIDEHRTFYLLVDGMGKGLSASLTAMTMTTFINHILDKMIEYDSFAFEILVKESIDYIKPILLDEEAVAIDYILFNHHFHTLEYAKFAMPPFLLQTKDKQIQKIKSNNPPLSKWQNSYKIDEYNIKNITKFLFYSDGVVENSLKNENETYASKIENDFQESFTKEQLREKIFDQILEQEDDLTMIFIHNIKTENALVANKVFETSLEAIENSFEWYETTYESICTKETQECYDNASIVFTELIMNAYEHGNLGLSLMKKHQLLEHDTYYNTLLDMEVDCNKKIFVDIYKLVEGSSIYILTQIRDEGNGFDTQLLSSIFRNSKLFNGRGVFVSRKNSMGIYYNAKGNKVIFLNKI